MKTVDWTTPVLIFCVVMGFIANYWWGYYWNEKHEIEKKLTPEKVEVKEWPIENGIDPKG